MVKLKIKKGDNVLVIAGKDKGKTGKVIETSAQNGKVLVENVNIVTKHKKPRSAKEKGGIVKQPAPIEVSNLMVVCPTCGKATRVAKKSIEGVNARICKKCGAGLDKGYVKAAKKEAKKAEVKEEKAEKTEAKETKTTRTTKAKSTTAKSAVKPTAAKAKTQTAKKAGRGN